MERPLRLGKPSPVRHALTMLSSHRPMPSARRFPSPWIVEEHADACFIVKDATGQALGYFYFDDKPQRRSATKLTDPRRGPSHGDELRQAAGTTSQALTLRRVGGVEPGSGLLRTITS